MNEVEPTQRDQVSAVFEAQRRFFETGRTRPRAFREAQLRAFLAAIQRHEERIDEALREDLRKPPFEAWTTETSILLGETKHALTHLKRWMTPVRTFTPIVAQPARSAVHAQPLGPTLILGAWNYPVHLSLAPLIPAIAAGNVAIVKPSELAPASSSVVAEILHSTFSPDYIACVEGGVETSQSLLELPFAHYFYTGGTRVGKIVAKAAAEHLARCTLELGGKSPCIVSSKAHLEVAARRVAWGKWINAGQTCVAPDYVLCHEDVHDEFVALVERFVREMYGDDPQVSPDLGRIVDVRHHKRLVSLLDPEKIRFGGQHDDADRYLAPTLMTDVTWDDPVMQEEIFGPILPVLKIRSLDEVASHVRRAPNPLALYLFTEDADERDRIVDEVSFGGGCINNCVVHLADPNLPFGGIGTSGVGSYHGKHGFDAFSHYKGIIDANTTKVLDLPLKYPPFHQGKLDKAKWLLG